MFNERQLPSVKKKQKKGNSQILVYNKMLNNMMGTRQ